MFTALAFATTGAFICWSLSEVKSTSRTFKRQQHLQYVKTMAQLDREHLAVRKDIRAAFNRIEASSK